MHSSLDFKIREGKPEDLPQLMGLVKELAEYERALDQVETSVEQMQRDGFGEKPLFGFFVAEKGTEILGMALYYYRYSTWKGKVLYLEDLYIKEVYRRYKIGFYLFEALIAHAREENCSRISWQVLEWNEPAIRFYEKIGSEFDGEWVNGFLCKDRFPIFEEVKKQMQNS